MTATDGPNRCGPGTRHCGERQERGERCSLSLTRDQADTFGRMLIWIAARPDPTMAHYAAGGLGDHLREVIELEAAYGEAPNGADDA